MPFGLCNAPATFECFMERVLDGLPSSECLVYLDDVLVHATSFEEELNRLQEVFGWMCNAKLKRHTEKCHLFRQKDLIPGAHSECRRDVH